MFKRVDNLIAAINELSGQLRSSAAKFDVVDVDRRLEVLEKFACHLSDNSQALPDVLHQIGDLGSSVENLTRRVERLESGIKPPSRKK